MRISDWSSDVCSSDLVRRRGVADHLDRHRLDHQPLVLHQEAEPLPVHLLERGPHRGAVGEVDDQRLVGAGIAQMRAADALDPLRSEEHTSELQSLMRISYAVFCLNKNNTPYNKHNRI